ncbi:4Fe-4S dicluster domain-containing protein [Dehalococcoidia bacterium]|nr:4Fe-4S dicluster domain-containing protein [Dehalococcoidia bacterium]
MSFYIDDDACISCGACEYICDTYAITKRDNQRGTFIIDPMLCFDCNLCPDTCPVDCIHQDTESIICHGRGCPLNAKSKYAEWECSELKERCTSCDNVLWREPGTTSWVCFKCDVGKGICPKIKGLQKPGYEIIVRTGRPI